MNAPVADCHMQNVQSAQGWAVSLIGHGMAVGLALLITSNLKLVPQPKVFTWDVSVIEAPIQPKLTDPSPSESTPAQPPASAASRQPARMNPESIHRVVQQEVRQVEPIANPVVQTIVEPVVQAPPHETVSRTATPIPMLQQHNIAVESVPREMTEMQPSQERVVLQEAALVEKPVSMEAPRAPSVESAEASHPLRDATETSPPVQERTTGVESVIMPTQPAVIDSSFPKEIPMLTSPINATDSPGTKPIEQARLSGLPPVDNTLIGERLVQGKPGTKPDFGWLVQVLLSRVQQLKRYPPVARMNHWEGKVEVRAVIREDGQLADVAVAKSSGHQELDDDALDVVKQASPLHLSHALGKPQVTVRLPISYRLEH